MADEFIVYFTVSSLAATAEVKPSNGTQASGSIGGYVETTTTNSSSNGISSSSTATSTTRAGVEASESTPSLNGNRISVGSKASIKV